MGAKLLEIEQLIQVLSAKYSESSTLKQWGLTTNLLEAARQEQLALQEKWRQLSDTENRLKSKKLQTGAWIKDAETILDATNWENKDKLWGEYLFKRMLPDS